MELRDRVLARCIAGPGSCVLWTGAQTPAGYGQISQARRLVSVHRVTFAAFKGEIPEGLEIDHLCGVRQCVNPHHLEAVTHAENLRRSSNVVGLNVRKTHCPQGHEYSPENTYLRPRGPGADSRLCRACRRAHKRARTQRIRQSRLAPEPLRCRRCGDEDGPFVGTGDDTRCEPCARPVPLTQPIT